MSGHSKWSTIKRKKEVTDIAKGKLFSKLARAISMAIKAGGGVDPESNHKLRIAIDQAKAVNMPKINIERAIQRAQDKEGDLGEVVYEGFGPSGIAVMVEVTTDNRNRTGQEIKNLFERSGGNLAGPGSVSFNFNPKGLLLVEKGRNLQDQMLKLIDVEFVDDVEETQDGIEIYTALDKLAFVRKKVESIGFKIISAELFQKPNNFHVISDSKTALRVLNFLDALNEHDDVQKVYANLDIPDEVLEKVTTSG